MTERAQVCAPDLGQAGPGGANGGRERENEVGVGGLRADGGQVGGGGLVEAHELVGFRAGQTRPGRQFVEALPLGLVRFGKS